MLTRTKNIEEIKKVVCRMYGISLVELEGKCRRQGLVRARAEVALAAIERTPCSLREIGDALGGRDHTTIMHYIHRYKKKSLNMIL